MEEIIDQRFSYAEITPYKSYSHITDNNHSLNTFNDDIDQFKSFEDNLPIIKAVLNENGELYGSYGKKGIIYSLSPKDKKRKRYFYSDDSVLDRRVQLKYAYVKNHDTSFYTTSDRQIRHHYGDPFSSIVLYIYERSVRIHDDKVTIKLYKRTKYRSFNCIFFKKSASVISITLDLKTGNFITMDAPSLNKNHRRTIRKNSFIDLSQLLTNKNDFISPIKKGHQLEDTRIFDEYVKTFDDKVFLQAIYDGIGIKSDATRTKNIEIFFNQFINKFVELKKIKVPNCYNILLCNYYPTEKYLKKNNRKLVASILGLFHIKSKITIRIVHKYSRINIVSLAKVCGFFGKDYAKYIGNIYPDFFDKLASIEYNVNHGTCYEKYSYLDHIEECKTTDDDKENIIKLINSTNPNESEDPITDTNLITTIIDHINMVNKIREYYPNTRINAKNYSELRNEHIAFSKQWAMIQKGSSIQYIHSQETIETIQEPIYIGDYQYMFPVLFTREEEYVEEGEFMHHCVGSYANKEQSVIISLRMNNSQERVTSEFDIKSGRCIQSQYFCDTPPPEIFAKPLEILKEKVSILARKNSLNWKEKATVPLLINGEPIVRQVTEEQLIF